MITWIVQNWQGWLLGTLSTIVMMSLCNASGRASECEECQIARDEAKTE